MNHNVSSFSRIFIPPKVNFLKIKTAVAWLLRYHSKVSSDKAFFGSLGLSFSSKCPLLVGKGSSEQALYKFAFPWHAW